MIEFERNVKAWQFKGKLLGKQMIGDHEASKGPQSFARLLTITPPILMKHGGQLLLDAHYSNRLQSYLDAFAHVTIMCPQYTQHQRNLVDLKTINGHERVTVHVLPEPYREDRYFFHRKSVWKLLKVEIGLADIILIAPHAAFDWPTLAGLLALKLGCDYGIEADWDLHSVWRQNIRSMPTGIQKLRHLLWLKGHTAPYRKLLRGSRLALLEGATVFTAYKNLTPNPQQVLNVQITDEDRAQPNTVSEKQDRLLAGEKLRIAYAGRLISMKGPEDWVYVLSELKQQGVEFEATWLGDGPLRDQTLDLIEQYGLGGSVRLPGGVDRRQARELIERSDVFLFCHKTQESPRCLLEALALGTPLVGYESLHARHLTGSAGGGRFVPLNDRESLISAMGDLAANRPKLAQMMVAAHKSAMAFDRDEAVRRRIELLKRYLGKRKPVQPEHA